MHRGRQSDTEVGDIWRENGKYRRAPQSQQLQMAAEKDSLVGITAEKEMCSLKNTNFPSLVMHLSMENMILSQLDLIWENNMVSAYNSSSGHSWSLSDVTNISNGIYIPRESSDIVQEDNGPHILYEYSRDLCKTSVGHIGFNSICYDNFTAQNQRQVTEKIWNSYVGAINMRDLSCKRKPSAQLDGAQKRVKRSLNINKCGYLSPYFMELSEKTNTDFIPYAIVETKDEDSSVKPYEIKASTEKNTSMLRSARETGCNVKHGSKMSDDECYSGSVLKSLVISSSSLGVTEEVFSSTFIPQTDSSVDYTEQCSSQRQKGRCKVPDDSDESLCLTNHSDSNINLHISLSVHPCILTSDVILSDVNCTRPDERQGQNGFNRAARERRPIRDEMIIAANTLKSSQKNKSSLPRIDKRNRHCGNDDKCFLPTEKTFSIQLNYPQSLEKQHFLQNMKVSILAASLLAVSKNDFSFFQSSGLQSTSPMTDELFSSRHQGLNSEQAEVEVLLGSENVNSSTGRAHLDDKTALNKQDFCFPSCFQNGVDTEQSEKSGNSVDFYLGPTCSNQMSYTERFEKICLEKCLVESESSNIKEPYCSFPNEMLFYRSRTRQNNLNTVEYEPSKHKSCTKDATEDKESMEEVLSGSHYNIGDSSCYEKVVEDVEEVDMTSCNSDGMDEENPHVNSYDLDELLNRRPVSSTCVETSVNESSKHKIKMEQSLVVTKDNDDASSGGNKVLLEHTDFEMKVQFDLVLKELKMFHAIEEEKVENVKTEQGSNLEHTCSNAQKLEDGVKKTLPIKKVIVGSDSEDLVRKQDYIYDRKTTSEQEVPQTSYQGDEESLYSACNIDDISKSLSWTPAFRKCDRGANLTSQIEKAVTFSHGIGRVTPLKTRTGPLRIGLSKKAKIKQLHPYLR